MNTTKNQTDICPNCGGTGENANRLDQLKESNGTNFALAPTTLGCEDCGGSGEVPAREYVLVWEKNGDTGERKRFFGYFDDQLQAETAINKFCYALSVAGNAADCSFEEFDKTINPNFWEIKNGKPVSISRPIEGISLNGDEDLLDNENKLMIFASIAEARNFLLEKGCEEEDLESFNFRFNHTQSGILPIFSLIYVSNEQIHSSNGLNVQIENNDWFLGLNEEKRKKITGFMDSAEVGDTIFCEGVLVLRLKEDINVACDCCD